MTDPMTIPLFEEVPDIPLGEIFDLVDQTAKNLRRIHRRTFGDLGLTPPQYAVLNLLWERDGRPFKEFADALACTRSTITGIIDTLERKGLVVRMPNPVDRRSLLATLTTEGWNLQAGTPSLNAMYDTCCTGLTPLEFQRLGHLLHKLNESLVLPEV